MDGITPLTPDSSSDHLFVSKPQVGSSQPQVDVNPNVNPQPTVVPISVLTPMPVSVSTPNTAPDKVSYADAQIQEIEVSQVVANPYQPRKVFNPEALQELADSIREHGVIQPIVVTKTETGFEIVVGERRFRASQLAGLTRVPAIIKERLEDQTKLEVALIENIQRQELNAIEEAQAYDRLIKNFNMTQEQVAKKVGKSRPAITNTLRLLNLPAEIQRAVVEGKISEGHARAILGLPDIERLILLYKTIVDQGLNVRQVEGKVRELTARRTMDSAAPDPQLMALETQLRSTLGTQVKIQRQGRGGRITIEFFSEEELDDIVKKMADTHDNQGNGFLTV
jgi:ParB family chromosome partitioning protein